MRPCGAARDEGEGDPGEDVDDVVVAPGDGREDEAQGERKEAEERLAGPPGRLDEDCDCHHRVPRREAVPPVGLEPVEGPVDRPRDRPAGERPGVRDRESRADRRDEEVAGVADVEDEEHPEDVRREPGRAASCSRRSSRQRSAPRTMGWK